MEPVTQDTAVSVIGLGEMGSALARSLLASGYAVTGWNRSREKAEKLAQHGAAIAESVLEAVKKGDVIVACVTDYLTLATLLHTPAIAGAMAGKALIQLTTRTPEEARTCEAWTREAGVACLEGSIQAYPIHIGTPEGAILYSGPRELFDAVHPVLSALTGQVVYVSDAIGGAAALDLSLAGTVVPGATVAFLQGAAICHAEGAPLDLYMEMVEQSIIPGLMLSTFRDSTRMIKQRDYAYTGDGAPLDAWVPGLQMVVQAAKDAGIDPRWNELVLDYLERSSAEGHGQSELAAIFEILCRSPA